MSALRLPVFVAAACALLSPALASAQSYDPYGYNAYGSSIFDWDGFYAGVMGGGTPFGDPASLSGGVFAGVNVTIDSALFGVESQLGIKHDDDSTAFEGLMLGRGGILLGEALVFGTAGAGLVGGDGVYAIGGGGEYGITNSISARVDALGIGEWGNSPDRLRVTAGLAFHM